jgi:hypothetical protein
MDGCLVSDFPHGQLSQLESRSDIDIVPTRGRGLPRGLGVSDGELVTSGRDSADFSRLPKGHHREFSSARVADVTFATSIATASVCNDRLHEFLAMRLVTIGRNLHTRADAWELSAVPSRGM